MLNNTDTAFPEAITSTPLKFPAHMFDQVMYCWGTPVLNMINNAVTSDDISHRFPSTHVRTHTCQQVLAYKREPTC